MLRFVSEPKGLFVISCFPFLHKHPSVYNHNINTCRILYNVNYMYQCYNPFWDNWSLFTLKVGGGKSTFVLQMFRTLLKEEGPKGLTKGLSARILSMVPSSIVMVLGYETVKRLSLKTSAVELRVQEEGYLEASFWSLSL